MGVRHARVGHAGQQNLRVAVRSRNSKEAAEQRKKGRTVAGRTGWIAFQKGARLREVLWAMNLIMEHNSQSTGSPIYPRSSTFAHFMWRRCCRVAWRSGDQVGVEFIP
jgi:hypothetical protein